MVSVNGLEPPPPPPQLGLGYYPFKGGGSVVVNSLSIVTPIVEVCNCSMFCCTLPNVHSSFAIILMGKRELFAVLSLSSSCLVIVVWLFLVVSWVCLQFVIVVFPDHTYLLFLMAQLVPDACFGLCPQCLNLRFSLALTNCGS